jgi:TFIIF-interacting CTD phosphatase-like protein
VEKFLKEVSRYFEVVIFSPNIAGTVDPIISGLDKVS